MVSKPRTCICFACTQSSLLTHLPPSSPSEQAEFVFFLVALRRASTLCVSSVYSHRHFGFTLFCDPPRTDPSASPWLELAVERSTAMMIYSFSSLDPRFVFCSLIRFSKKGLCFVCFAFLLHPPLAGWSAHHLFFAFVVGSLPRSSFSICRLLAATCAGREMHLTTATASLIRFLPPSLFTIRLSPLFPLFTCRLTVTLSKQMVD